MINIQKTAFTVAALGAIGFGSATIAGAAGNSTSSSSSSSTAAQAKPARPAREALSSDVAAKVKAAALDKVPGATVVRTEAGGPYGTAYHAHIKKSDGTLAVVTVDKDFKALAVQADDGRGPGGRPGGRHGGPGGGGAGETPLTGDVKEKVEAAALAKVSGGKIVRTETNNDGTAPYESHVTRSDGTEVEVLVSKDYKVVDVREHPARP